MNPEAIKVQTLISSLPLYWQLLDRTDLEDYLKLKYLLEEDQGKSCKGERFDFFSQRLEQIKAYICKDEANKWKRSLVCGIIFLKNGIAINIQNFKILLSRCKSSINGSLQQLGYNTSQSNLAMSEEIKQQIPLFSNSPVELKRWTFRENKPLNEIVHEKSNTKKPFIIDLPKPPKFVVPILSNNNKSPCQSQNAPSEKKSSGYRPLSLSDPKMSTEEMQKLVLSSFPCPLKYRYKIYDTIYQSISIQTEA